MEEKSKIKNFFTSLPDRLRKYFSDYFKNLNYPLWILFIVLSVGLFLLDYFTKRAAYYDTRLQGGEIVDFIPGFLSFYLVGNKGAAWGTMSGWSWFLIPVSMLASIMLTLNLVFRFRKYNWGMTIGIMLMLPGALGNLIDRVGFAAGLEPYDKGVIDFLRFTFWPSFPICNIADYCLTVGVVFLIIGFVFEFKKEYKAMKEEEKKEAQSVKSEEEIKDDNEMMQKLSQISNEKDKVSNENQSIENKGERG